jgi:23S rRNA pseudouridine2605 synthase
MNNKKKPFVGGKGKPEKKRPLTRKEKENYSAKTNFKPSPFAKKVGVQPNFSQPVNPTKNIDQVRLNKFLADAGLGSRREADEIIKTGLVEVNGKIITELGFKVSPGDVVKYGGDTLSTGKLVYFLLNKPRGYVTTSKNIYHRRTVGQLMRDAGKHALSAVGRMDKETTGLLLLTNDATMVNKLSENKGRGKKIYHVRLTKPVNPEHIEQMRAGVSLSDGIIKADSIAFVDGEKSLREVGVEIKAMRNSIVRRMFEHFGYTVEKLDRVFFCGLTKKGLAKGQWRELTRDEVTMLKMI